MFVARFAVTAAALSVVAASASVAFTSTAEASAPAETVSATRATLTMAIPKTMVGAEGKTGRIAIFSTETGGVVKYLTAASTTWDEGLPAYSADRTKIVFIRDSTVKAVLSPRVWGTFAVSVNGGTAKELRTAEEGGAQPFATGPKNALAGITGGIATSELVAVNAEKTSVYLVGTRQIPVDTLAWAPDGVHLAIGTAAVAADVRVVDTRTATDIVAKPAPCPATLSGCTLHAPGYDSLGRLYAVAVNRSGSASYLVRRASSTQVPRVLAKLPNVAGSYRVFAAPSGAILVSGLTYSPTVTASTFVATWDGAHVRQLTKKALQPAW